MLKVFFDSAPVTNYAPILFGAFVNQTKVSTSGAYDTLRPTHSQFWGPQYPNVTLGVTLEPFDGGLFTHGSGSTYPPDRSHVISQTAITIVWFNRSTKLWLPSSQARSALRPLQKYVNFVLYGTPVREHLRWECGGFARSERQLIQKACQ